MSGKENCSNFKEAIEQLLGGSSTAAVIYDDARSAYDSDCIPFKMTMQNASPFNGLVVIRQGYVGRFEGTCQGNYHVAHCVGPCMEKPLPGSDSTITSWEFFRDSEVDATDGLPESFTPVGFPDDAPPEVRDRIVTSEGRACLAALFCIFVAISIGARPCLLG